MPCGCAVDNPYRVGSICREAVAFGDLLAELDAPTYDPVRLSELLDGSLRLWPRR
jgi:hypothetical protein